ncbi:hypothetical protein BRD04_04660 [Halobacteriales archaeon QS_9_67_17]|nr:MAG: hypothetical protein BRD04_04660 [Halobacteriales archaeon QS_9_67_17]
MADARDESVEREIDDDDATLSVALGFESARNRELLAGLLERYDVVTAEQTVPDGTDICIVDAGGFERLREPLAAWRREERPTAAPALLVSSGDENELWNRYADVIGESIDGVQPVPAPKRAIRSRISGFAALRRYSERASDQQDQLELYGRAMDDAQVGITIADATAEELPLVYVNEQFCRLTGYSREEVLGRGCQFLQGPETDESKRQQFRDAFAVEEPVTVELVNYRKDGEQFWNEVEVLPVYEDGSVTHYIGFQRDVTERRERETQLEAYEHIIQTVTDPVLVLDTEGHVTYTNGTAQETFGPVPNRTTFADLFDDDGAAAVEDALSTLRELGEEQTRELSLFGSTGGAATYQVRFQLASFGGEEQVIVVARDITDIRRHQNRLAVLDRVLRHNLRNKLNIVAGHAQTLTAQSPEGERVSDAAESIETATGSLLDIVNAIREFDVRPDEASAVERDVAAFVRECEPELRTEYPSVELTTDLPETARARCPAQLRFCLDELVGSAVERANEPPTIWLTVTAGVETVTLRVRSDGEPLPDVEQRALAAGTETQLEHTQGVGIWLTQWAVEAVGGGLRVEQGDDGTTVALTFPAHSRS